MIFRFTERIGLNYFNEHLNKRCSEFVLRSFVYLKFVFFHQHLTRIRHLFTIFYVKRKVVAESVCFQLFIHASKEMFVFILGVIGNTNST